MNNLSQQYKRGCRVTFWLSVVQAVLVTGGTAVFVWGMLA